MYKRGKKTSISIPSKTHLSQVFCRALVIFVIAVLFNAFTSTFHFISRFGFISFLVLLIEGLSEDRQLELPVFLVIFYAAVIRGFQVHLTISKKYSYRPSIQLK